MVKKRKRQYALTPETKIRFHRNARCRSAKPQVERWLTARGIDITQFKKRKDMFRAFLQELGEYDHSTPVNVQIESIYTDAANDLLTRQVGLFYLSREWRAVRRRVIRRYGKVCMKCGSRDHIAVDHIKPRSKHPELELDESNLQVLCRRCNCSKSDRHTNDYRPHVGLVNV